MTITEQQLKALLQEEIKGLHTKVGPNDIGNAIDDATRQTGWTLPISGGFKEFWFKDRAKRNLFFYLMSEAAHKFKFEGINLQNRFQHYKSLIEWMDAEYLKAYEANIHEFAGVEAYQLFGTKVDAGFQYDIKGADTTYSSDNQVIVGSSED